MADRSSTPILGRLYSYALIPPPDIAHPLGLLRARFDPDRAAQVPHVTMKLPFTLGRTLNGEADLLSLLTRECLREVSLEVDLGEVDVFDSCGQHGHVVHVRVALTPALRALHDRLVVALARNGVETRAVTPEREMELFFPHLTVAQGLTAERAVQVLGAARAHHEPQSFQAERLVLGRSWDELSWEVAQEVILAAAE